MDIELSTNIVTCPECNCVLQYYDLLSHNEICYNTNESTILETNSEIQTNTINNTNVYNGLNDYGNYGNYDNNNTNNLNLYNPMINRDIQNSNNNSNNNNNDNDTIYTLNNYLLSLNINNNNNTYMDCGLNKIELENNSKIIECNNDTDCPICLCKYPQYTHFYLMNCNHYFCIECSKNWFSKKSVCPLCRKNYKKL